MATYDAKNGRGAMSKESYIVECQRQILEYLFDGCAKSGEYQRVYYLDHKEIKKGTLTLECLFLLFMASDFFIVCHPSGSGGNYCRLRSNRLSRY